MEMRIGKRARTISRSARAAQAIGPDIGVIVDSNQQLTVQCAIKVGRAMEEFNLTWFEEPIPLSDHARRGGNRRGPLLRAILMELPPLARQPRVRRCCG
jgi:L-alanine-DL-glutamate epimerase-like enolase superfamily enzyme